MAKLYIHEPDRPYHAVIDTEAMAVEIRDAFIGLTFITDDGEKLVVCMRDGGFEVHYSGDFGEKGFDGGWTEFKAGRILRQEDRDYSDGKKMMFPEELLSACISSESDLDERLKAWERATIIIDDILAQPGNELHEYERPAWFGSPSLTYTVADQRIRYIMDIANWLLNEQE